MLTIDFDTARRFILAKQGLWPGRRWRGLEGTEGRVHNYVPETWEELTYRQRKFFDRNVNL